MAIRATDATGRLYMITDAQELHWKVQDEGRYYAQQRRETRRLYKDGKGLWMNGDFRYFRCHNGDAVCAKCANKRDSDQRVPLDKKVDYVCDDNEYDFKCRCGTLIIGYKLESDWDD